MKLKRGESLGYLGIKSLVYILYDYVSKISEPAKVPYKTVRPDQGLEILFVYLVTDCSPVLGLVSDDFLS